LDLKSEKAIAEIAFYGKTILGAGYRKIEAAIFISPTSDRPNSRMRVLGFELELLLIYKLMRGKRYAASGVGWKAIEVLRV
jgi:hypothetical protein